MTQVLEERPEQLILLHKNDVVCVPNSTYTKVKYKLYKGRRIKYTFSKDHKIEETYNDRIFNIRVKEFFFQTRHSLADDVCNLIYNHKLTKDLTPLQEFFRKEYSQSIQDEILNEYLNPISHVKKVPEGYTVYNQMLVTDEGVARTLSDKKHICIVCEGSRNTITLPYKGQMVDLNERTYTILTKILYLLHPDMNDTVFVKQLPKEVKEFYDNLKGGEEIEDDYE